MGFWDSLFKSNEPQRQLDALEWQLEPALPSIARAGVNADEFSRLKVGRKNGHESCCD